MFIDAFPNYGGPWKTLAAEVSKVQCSLHLYSEFRHEDSFFFHILESLCSPRLSRRDHHQDFARVQSRRSDWSVRSWHRPVNPGNLSPCIELVEDPRSHLL